MSCRCQKRFMSLPVIGYDFKSSIETQFIIGICAHIKTKGCAEYEARGDALMSIISVPFRWMRLTQKQLVIMISSLALRYSGALKINGKGHEIEYLLTLFTEISFKWLSIIFNLIEVNGVYKRLVKRWLEGVAFVMIRSETTWIIWITFGNIHCYQRVLEVGWIVRFFPELKMFCDFIRKHKPPFNEISPRTANRNVRLLKRRKFSVRAEKLYK